MKITEKKLVKALARFLQIGFVYCTCLHWIIAWLSGGESFDMLSRGFRFMVGFNLGCIAIYVFSLLAHTLERRKGQDAIFRKIHKAKDDAEVDALLEELESWS